MSVSQGVPQGSVLGPLLFLLYVSEIPNISNNSHPILFADDTTLTFTARDIPDLTSLCNSELSIFLAWASANKLTINFGRDKTYYMLHSFRALNMSELNISMNNNLLQNLDEASFLGVVIDKKLK